ncbi:MAG: hypothetical protein KatS3mg002_0936 [Candidatus Woesearchaeota archaeon]|nr:MAG: hypothetical protein KatS3mg002_0936 [Candidatus Woesearchaeota archaeon]
MKINRDYFINNGIEVIINDMKTGEILFSRNYSICNALVFSDGKTTALAHISKATTPEMLMSGYVSNLLVENPKEDKRYVKKISEIFEDPDKIIAYHIHRNDGCWSDSQIRKELINKNIKDNNIYSFQIKNNSFRTRDIGVTMKNKRIYIFPRSYYYELEPIIMEINNYGRLKKIIS